MTEKLKLTKEQEKAIKMYKSKGYTLQQFAKYAIEWKEEYESLKRLSIDQMARLLYEPNSYEVELEYKVGDWVVKIEGGSFLKGEIAMQVQKVGLHYVDFSHDRSLNVRDLRHATPEEIKAEKERQVWAKTGRKVGEFTDNDIGIDNRNIIRDGKVDLEQYYRNGCLKGFYPSESFISFESVESND